MEGHTHIYLSFIVQYTIPRKFLDKFLLYQNETQDNFILFDTELNVFLIGILNEVEF